MTQLDSIPPTPPQDNSRKTILGILGALLGLVLGLCIFFFISVAMIMNLNSGSKYGPILPFLVFLLVTALAGWGTLRILSDARPRMSPVLHMFLLCLAIGIGVAGLGVGLCDLVLVLDS